MAALLFAIASCDNPRPGFEGGSQTGDLNLLGESCSCVFYPDDDEVFINCAYRGEFSGRNFTAWIATSPRYNESALGNVYMWVTEPGEICYQYGGGVAETWVGPPEPDRAGITDAQYAPVHIRRWVVPEQQMCQGDGVSCFDYEACIDWPESTADDIFAWCPVSYF